MFAKDKRMKVMNEMLLGMKSIKMYSWEPIFERMIVNARKEEVYHLYLNLKPTFCLSWQTVGNHIIIISIRWCSLKTNY